MSHAPDDEVWNPQRHPPDSAPLTRLGLDDRAERIAPDVRAGSPHVGGPGSTFVLLADLHRGRCGRQARRRVRGCDGGRPLSPRESVPAHLSLRRIRCRPDCPVHRRRTRQREAGRRCAPAEGTRNDGRPDGTAQPALVRDAIDRHDRGRPARRGLRCRCSCSTSID